MVRKKEQKFQHSWKRHLKFSQDLFSKVHPSSASTAKRTTAQRVLVFFLTDGKWGTLCYRKIASNSPSNFFLTALLEYYSKKYLLV